MMSRYEIGIEIAFKFVSLLSSIERFLKQQHRNTAKRQHIFGVDYAKRDNSNSR